ncbi:ShlB/FhaC/HecB family hemolysin secretion/activation protein [Asaia astilbis]|uniref:ShlB/FhaC/HecB family hemolysin secretion/activation protein n=1 Tax=Asaia astilbis TaxID=610244 RepID=UPI00046E8AA2|nr:ShlB/FhaC/HecB family hemolysin secretion/activation protein [Asaia astilbis]
MFALRVIRLPLAGVFCLLSCSVAVAQTPMAAAPPAVMPAGPGSSQDQFQRYRQRQQQLDMLPPPDSNTQFHNPSPLKGGGNCVQVWTLSIENAPHLGDAAKRGVMQRYSGRCLGVDDFNHALDDIKRAYVQQGNVTSRAYLPEQSLQSGRLRLVVVEGTLSSIRFTGMAARHHELMGFPGLRDHLLNLRDLEQGLDQMNRMPNWSATMQIVPGEKSGSSSVVVQQMNPGVLHGQIWADNNGQYQTGHETGHAMLTAQDALGLLDMWSVEYDHSLVGQAGHRGTQFFSADGSIPYGKWSIFGGFWMSDDVYHLQSLGEDYRLGGRRRDFRVGVSRVVARNSLGVTTLQALYELKSFNSTTNHVRLFTQSARQASVATQASESLKALGGLWYVTLGVRFGTDGVGTRSAFAHPIASEPHTRFVKPSLDIDGYEPLPFGLSWHVSLHGELSSRNQFATEQLQLGGPYTVRGFLSQMLVGNKGLYVRDDVSYRLAPLNLHEKCGAYSGFCRAFVDGTEFYGIIDGGFVKLGYRADNLPPALRGGSIAGAGFGLRKVSGTLFWGASATHAIAHGPLPDEGWIAAFQAGVRF